MDKPETVYYFDRKIYSHLATAKGVRTRRIRDARVRERVTGRKFDVPNIYEAKVDWRIVNE